MKIGRYSGMNLSRELFRAFGESGIEMMEISIGTKRQSHLELQLRELKAWGDEFGVELWSYHMPGAGSSLVDPNKEARLQLIELHRNIMGRAREVGIRHFVVHPSGEPIPSEHRAEMIDRCKESLMQLAEIARKEDTVIAVENLPRTCLGNSSAEMLELLSADKDLRVCFDTNHLLGEDNMRLLDAVGDKIVTIHVSDYDFIDEKHWLPGEGKNDWQRIYKKLSAVGYKGPWLYEVDFSAPTITRHRDLVCADYVRNAREIFEGRPLTVIE